LRQRGTRPKGDTITTELKDGDNGVKAKSALRKFVRRVGSLTINEQIYQDLALVYYESDINEKIKLAQDAQKVGDYEPFDNIMYMIKANTVKKSSKEAVFKDEILYKMFIKMAPLIIEEGY
jgi:hypothetical protein